MPVRYKIPPNKHQRAQAAAFGDMDGDGHVDLYVSNYEDWKDNTYPYPHLLFKNRGGDKGFSSFTVFGQPSNRPAAGCQFPVAADVRRL